MSDAITPFVPANLEQASKLADTLARSSLLPDALRGKPADVMVMLITGCELGLSPMQAIRGLHVIKGKAVMSADLQVALVKKHRECEYFKLVDSTDQKAMYETQRKGERPTPMSFTIDQAKTAGLLGNDNWRKYPAAMLRARCASALARAVYPDLTLGVYDPDELNAPDPSQPPERELNPPPPPTQQATPVVVDAVRVSAPTPPAKPVPTPGKGVSALKEKVLAKKQPTLTVGDDEPGRTPFEEIRELGKLHNLEGKALAAFVREAGITKTKPEDFVRADLQAVAAALIRQEQAALGREPPPDVKLPTLQDNAKAKRKMPIISEEEPPPPTDADNPFGGAP